MHCLLSAFQISMHNHDRESKTPAGGADRYSTATTACSEDACPSSWMTQFCEALAVVLGAGDTSHAAKDLQEKIISNKKIIRHAKRLWYNLHCTVAAAASITRCTPMNQVGTIVKCYISRQQHCKILLFLLHSSASGQFLSNKPQGPQGKSLLRMRMYGKSGTSSWCSCS